MVPHLNSVNVPTEFDVFRSHSHKPLRVHTNGVLAGVERHTTASIARVATLFHDTGKLNPHFQPKLDGISTGGYDHHAYLSAFVFLSYCAKNPKISGLGLTHPMHVFAVLALIARHHGHLPHLRNIFSLDERARLMAFLDTNPALPVSPFLAQWLSHQPFDALDTTNRPLMEKFNGLLDTHLQDFEGLSDFWFDTQFGFAALIESDKRDASDNKRFQRDEQLSWAKASFAPPLLATFDRLQSGDKVSDLNQLRTNIRNEAVSSVHNQLKEGKRIFTHTAPTGAGKTFTLLALAEEIRRGRDHLGMIYGLPFLSITEQVEGICREIWEMNEEFVSRFDSRAQNQKLDDLLGLAETNPHAVTELSQEHFSAQTFDSAFIITTFVQIFETLFSNRNATLLKLPNFAKTIFLLDEIQALPPRLYIFFTAYLRVWCEKFDCYAILSTATMPHLKILTSLPEHHKHHPRRLFPDYEAPDELLNYRHYFKEDVFNRYEIIPHGKWNTSQLADALEGETESCLVILNTIQDTKDLFAELTQSRELLDTEVVLLNTHFILDDRRCKITDCKAKLAKGERVLLISTQLIEAGVDIDFPVVYRDWCPLPNLIQSAGRCNRNKKMECGRVIFFTLVDENNKPRAHCIYRHPSDKNLLEQTHAVLATPHRESELLDVQRAFFEGMARNFAIGDHPLWVNDKRDEHANLIEYIADFNFPVVGSFRLIDEREFGEEFQLFVSSGLNDERWEQLSKLVREIAQAHEADAGREVIQILQIRLDGALRGMSGRVVAVRCKENALPPGEKKKDGQVREICGLRKLVHPDIDYSSETGLKLGSSGIAIL